ncbi:RNA ligase family protein [Bacillus cereus]|uniref:RNA ligase family protein n=1 Tax=Bacillus cereus TaxID=1396 RepID=UPI003079BF3D
MKKYMDIPRLGHQTTLDYLIQAASKGHIIRIAIKYDGANAQFEANDDNELLIYGRKTVLDEENNLRGFYQYVHSKVDPSRLPKGYKIFGEWLVSHTVSYPNDAYGHFYLFNIFDDNAKEYIKPDSEIYKQIRDYLVGELGMKEEEVLYEGPYLNLEKIEEILRTVTKDGIEYTGQKPETMEDVFHEGIVIKSYDYRDKHGNQLFVKCVGEKFKEVKKVKVKTKNKGPDTSIEAQIANFAATEARVEKILNKLIDEGVLVEELELEHMDIIAKNLPKRVFEDIMKEELDTIKVEFGEFDGKLIGKKININAMKFAREIVTKRIEDRFNKESIK